MKIKVCGMRNLENVQSLIALKPDFMGFVFYKKSKRFVTDFPKVDFPKEIKKVGVFVNENIEEVLKIVENYHLDCVQLHGDESPEYCETLRNSHLERSRKIDSESHQITIFKAFSVDEYFNFNITNQFELSCNYFLFDTKGKEYGGNGIKFNWDLLQNYKGKTPFLLSGGISKNDAPQIMSFLSRQESKHCIGIDINSGFETEPALKNISDIKEFKNNLL